MKNIKKTIKLNLEHTMIKIRFTLMAMIITLGACSSYMKKEINVYVESGKYGWYFVFIENVDRELSDQEAIPLDLTDENFATIKLYEPAKYKLGIYNKDSKKELSKKMKLISYSGNYGTVQVCKFYYPDSEKYPDAIFDADVNDPKSLIKRDIERNGSTMLDSIMKQQGIQW